MSKMVRNGRQYGLSTQGTYICGDSSVHREKSVALDFNKQAAKVWHGKTQHSD